MSEERQRKSNMNEKVWVMEAYSNVYQVVIFEEIGGWVGGN